MNRASYQKIPNLTLGQKRAINSPVKKPAQKPNKTASKLVNLSLASVIAPKPQGRTVLSLKH